MCMCLCVSMHAHAYVCVLKWASLRMAVDMHAYDEQGKFLVRR